MERLGRRESLGLGWGEGRGNIKWGEGVGTRSIAAHIHGPGGGNIGAEGAGVCDGDESMVLAKAGWRIGRACVPRADGRTTGWK